MKPIKIVTLFLSLISFAGAFADAGTSLCKGEPKVLCSFALGETEKFAVRNFRSFGTGQRRIFKGQLHTFDINGIEHQGEAMGKTIIWPAHPDIRFQSKEDPNLRVSASVNYQGTPGDDLTNYNPNKLFFGFFVVGSGHLSAADLRVKVTPALISTYKWTFDELEVRDVVTQGYGKAGRLKHLKMRAILPTTLNDLMEANFVPSYVDHQGADLDLVRAVDAGTLQIGETIASLKTNGSFFISRWKKEELFVIEIAKGKFVKVPNEELPIDCLKHPFAEVGYKADITIPATNLSETSVKNLKTEVLKCWGEFEKEGDRD